jgi:hypothetical protein
VFERFTKLSEETAHKREFAVLPENDAVCSRLIFAFRLH